MSWVCWLSKQQNSGDSGVYLQLKLLAGADIWPRCILFMMWCQLPAGSQAMKARLRKYYQTFIWGGPPPKFNKGYNENSHHSNKIRTFPQPSIVGIQTFNFWGVSGRVPSSAGRQRESQNRWLWRLPGHFFDTKKNGPSSKKYCLILLMEEIRNNHLGYINLVNNGIT